MQKLSLNQLLSQKLSPQQIQFIKLLQVPTAELDARILEEIEINPALEEGKEEEDIPMESEIEEKENSNDEIDIEEYLNDDAAGYKMQGDGVNEETDKQILIPTTASLSDFLHSQLSFLRLSEKDNIIGKQLIGSIDGDGYIRRELGAIVNDLAFSQNVETNIDEIEQVLLKIQRFDPPGIGARNLQECLMLQLERKEEGINQQMALEIVGKYFTEFTKKHYEKIQKKLNIDGEVLKEAISIITKLNPKPGEVSGNNLVGAAYVIPDYTLKNSNGKLELSLNSKNAPELKINRSYAEMLDSYDKSDKKDKKVKETVSFVKQKLDAAKWFIDAIKQRQQTLMNTMEAILEFQYDFFFEGDETKLRPMILKDIADKIDMDISTVSRVANSKYIQTDFGIYPLKYFFSEGIATDSGEDVSSREVKQQLKDMVDNEDKSVPLSDEKLEKLLKEKGYKIARRTVAKYREQLGIPVARLRKEL